METDQNLFGNVAKRAVYPSPRVRLKQRLVSSVRQRAARKVTRKTHSMVEDLKIFERIVRGVFNNVEGVFQ